MMIGRVLSLSPFGWAFAAPGCLAQGQFGMALVLTAGALMLPVVLMPLWGRVVRRVMSGDRATGRRGRPERLGSAAQAPHAASDGAADATTGSFERRLSRVLPSRAAAIAARCLRYWRTDPRYLALGLSSTLIMLVVGIVVVLSMTTGSADSDVIFMIAPAKAALGEAPAALLGVPVGIALMSGWVLHDDLAYDSTALWMHLSAGVRGRDDRLGRMLAAALWHLPVLMIGTAALGAWTGRWDIVPASIGTQLGLYGAAAAWSAVVSALLPYEVNAPGESPLKSRTSGMILLASLVQTIGLMVIAVLVLPVVIGIWVLAATGAWQWGWALLVGGALWGAGLAWAGAVWGGRALDRRWVQILTTVRSWPGHADTR